MELQTLNHLRPLGAGSQSDPRHPLSSTGATSRTSAPTATPTASRSGVTTLPGLLGYATGATSGEGAAVFSTENIPTLSEAQQVASLMRRTYPHGYPNPRALEPALLIEDLQAGVHTLVTLKGDHGQIVAVGALRNCCAEPRTLGSPGTYYEIGKLAVDPLQRNRGYSKRILAEIHGLAERLGADVVAAFGVTAHPYSQQALSSVGLKVSGKQINDWPAVFGTGYRETTLMMTKVLNDAVLKPQEVFVPPSLVRPLQHAYSIFGCERTFASSPGLGKGSLLFHHLRQTPQLELLRELPASGRGEQIVRLDDEPAQTVHFAIPPSCNTETLARLVIELAASGSEFITARLNISDPSALEQLPPLLQIGFRYASLVPLASGDILMLQRPTELPGLETLCRRICLSEEVASDARGFLPGIYGL